MARKKSEKKIIPLERLPESFRKALVKLMASEGLDLYDGLERAAVLLEPNSEEYNRIIRVEANRAYKSNYMTSLNKVRKTWQDEKKKELDQEHQKGFEEGMDWQRKEEHAFHLPCSVCGKLMHFSNWDENWSLVNETLKMAFSNWRHTGCG